MKSFFTYFFLITGMVYAQNVVLAREYFKKGEFEKALHEYKKLHEQTPNNIDYVNQLAAVYQELGLLNDAEKLLQTSINTTKYAPLYVELGYNYQLKNENNLAQQNYQLAFKGLEEKPVLVYVIANAFQKHALLNEAILAYEKGMALNPENNYTYQLAQLYGEQGNIEKMFMAYCAFAETNPSTVSAIKRLIGAFISEDATAENNALLRKILLKKSQESTNTIWNELLSWLFIQQKEYSKAFVQEKAIYTRNPERLKPITDLAQITISENQPEIAKTILNYILQTAQNRDDQVHAAYQLIQLEIKETPAQKLMEIDQKFQSLFNTYGLTPQTLELQIGYANYLAFQLKDYLKATQFLEDTLKLQLNTIQNAEVKLVLGDILVLQEKFNNALIYYTQIQRNLKNSTISQEARFKVAKTSYYKGDFKWAEAQLDVLKESTSQLIANDALELKLLISDNKYDDSLQTALKLYAKADLMAYQNKTTEAIALLSTILQNHSSETIYPQVLFKQAAMFELQKDYQQAQKNYELIIANYPTGILIDDALFKLASLLQYQLDQPEAAKKYYEKIIFNHPDSIFFVDARKRYRALRGDVLN